MQLRFAYVGKYTKDSLIMEHSVNEVRGTFLNNYAVTFRSLQITTRTNLIQSWFPAVEHYTT